MAWGSIKRLKINSIVDEWPNLINLRPKEGKLTANYKITTPIKIKTDKDGLVRL